MSLIAMVTAKHSPGASTAAMAMTMTWQTPVVLVEADPAGADTPTGLLQGGFPASHGLLGLAMAARSEQGLNPNSVIEQCVALDGGQQRLLLPGLHDPAQAAGVGSWWSHLAPLLHGRSDMDVIADCGRLGASYAPVPLWQQADLLILVLRPTVSQVHLARLWIRNLAENSGDTRIAAQDRLALLVVDEPAAQLSVKQVTEQVSVPGHPPLTVLGSLPHDPSAAAVLDGRAPRSARFERGQFMRAAAQIGRAAWATAGNNRTTATAASRRSPTLVERFAAGGSHA